MQYFDKQISNSSPKLSWFNNAKFGMFIHWGLYSIPARGEWIMFKENIPKDEYNKLADQFNPEHFDASAWAKLAKKAGAKYMVLTTRHHDGFSLYDSKVNPFNSMQTAAGRDFVAEYVEACRSEGLGVGLYHSIMSWQWPAIITGPNADPEGWKTMVNESHEQVRELMTNYGKIDLLWYDGAVVPGIQDSGMIMRFWESEKLNAMVRELQPQILINNRSGSPEDFSTPEQHVSPPEPGRPWEACMTINQSWGYNATDKKFKSPNEIIKCLTRCARYGGNLLLNVGPKPDGTVQEECVEILEQTGAWLKDNGEAIYNSERSTYTENEHVAGPVTQIGNKLYFHIQEPETSIRLDGITAIKNAEILVSEQKLQVSAKIAGATDITGLNVSDKTGELPIVLAVELEKYPEYSANFLGGGDTLRIEAGDTPVLGEDPDRYTPPQTPVISGGILKKLFNDPAQIFISDSEGWCPGWANQQVISPAKTSKTISLKLEIKTSGTYDLKLGIISNTPGIIELQVGNSAPAKKSVGSPGCPDTYTLDKIYLKEGIHQLSINSESVFGLYALHCSPCWRPVPVENWWSIGPFPTKFGPQQPVSEVRKAMKTEYPPEYEFVIDKTYDGSNKLQVGWNQTNKRLGDHSDEGVNFPYLCGTEASGVCYARTLIESSEECDIEILLGCDWWANLKVNGKPVKSERPQETCEVDGSQFNGWKPVPAKVELKKGINEVLVKSHCGSCANWFTFFINDSEDLKIISNSIN
jgi:alpha-L-fucosidase